jgi:hypothetical protein
MGLPMTTLWPPFEKELLPFVDPNGTTFRKNAKILFTFEEDARPAADQALQHKWLVRMRKRLRQEHHDGELWQSLTEALQALELFRSRNSTLKQATSVLLASQFMTKEDRQHIDPLFRELDGHCQGRDLGTTKYPSCHRLVS